MRPCLICPSKALLSEGRTCLCPLLLSFRLPAWLFLYNSTSTPPTPACSCPRAFALTVFPAWIVLLPHNSHFHSPSLLISSQTSLYWPCFPNHFVCDDNFFPSYAAWFLTIVFITTCLCTYFGLFFACISHEVRVLSVFVHCFILIV